MIYYRPPYTPPGATTISGSFTTTSGYVAPSPTEILVFLDGRPTHQATSYIQSIINATDSYRLYTHTYLKECPTIVVGFDTDGIKKVSLPCVYGGIRDINSYLRANTRGISNLNSQIWAESTVTVDLPSLIKGWVFGETKDLPTAIRPYISTYSDLAAYISIVTGSGETDLNAYIKGLTVGIPSDIESEIDGQHLRPVVSGTYDLVSALKLKGSDYKDLGSFLSTNYSLIDLGGEISPKIPADLNSIIGGVFEVNLGSYLNTIQPIDLSSALHSWDFKNIGASITGVYGPYDIRSSVTPIAPVDLGSIIDVYKSLGNTKDLTSIVSSFSTKDLNSYVGTIAGVNLGSSIVPHGGFYDLLVTIVPKVVHVKRFINISLMEHINLTGIINTACFFTGYKNLVSYISPVKKMDLRSVIWTSTGDNFKDLTSKINSGTIKVEDSITITLNRFTPQIKSTGFSVVSNPYVIDDILFKRADFKNIISSIIGQGLSSIGNIKSAISGISNLSYNSTPYEQPQFVGRETVINIDKFEGPLDWEREVLISFSDAARNYFYVDGTSKIYKEDRGRFWILKVEGYEYLTDDRVERGKIRSKYIFDLTQYATIDDAVRDAIKRVSEFNKINLTSIINPSGGTRVLRSSIIPYGGTYKSNKRLKSIITGIT